MSLVDVTYTVYNCPHCQGHIVLWVQEYLDGGGFSAGIEHLVDATLTPLEEDAQKTREYNR